MTESMTQNLSSCHIAVLYGGTSAERSISLKSGEAVISALKNNQLNVTAIDFDDTGLQQLMQAKPDVVFNILHGRGGEDGTVQGILDYLNIPYTGSGVTASSLTMDKLLTKRVLRDYQIDTPEFIELKDSKDCALVESSIGFPVMVKPIYEGSSIGMSLVRNNLELSDAFVTASQYGKVMAESLVNGREFTIGFLGDDVLPIIELKTNRQFYDFAAKYESNDTQYICPCDITEALETTLIDLVKQTINACQVKGWGRVDIMCDENDQAFVIEVNTTPGMTDHSLVPMAAKQNGLSFEQLVMCILDIALEQKETV